MSDTPKKAEPENLEIRARPRKVIRINRRAVVVVAAGVGAIALTISFLGGAHRSVPPPSPDESPVAPANSRPEGLSSLPEDYGAWRPAPELGPPAGELGRPVLHAEQREGLEGLGSSSFKQDPEVDAQRVARLRLQDEAEAAVKSSVLVQLRGGMSPRTSKSASEDRKATDQSDRGRESDVGASGPRDLSDQERKAAFAESKPHFNQGSTDQVQEPASPYQLLAGTVIAAALVTGINSDIPGQTTATVTENVYDSVAGRYLLVPQGSRLIGQYDSQVSFGQRRVLLVWTRLLMPNGDSVTLNRLPATDLSGRAGLEDRVDWHWDRVFAGAAVSTLLGINAQLADSERNGNSRTLIVASRQSAQDSINEVGQQLTRRNLNIQPTLSVRPGFPLRVLVNQDLSLRPYVDHR